MAGTSKLLMLLSAPFPLLYPRPAAALRLAARRPRIPLVAAVPGGRFLPVGAWPRPGFTFRAAKQVHTQASAAREGYGEASASVPSVRAAAAGHPWPEWTRLVEYVTAGGYSDRWGSTAGHEDNDSFSDTEGLTDEFVRAAEACLYFARDRPDLLRLLSKKDIQVVVENGSPFLFKNGESTARRLKSFLTGDGINVLESERAKTVDVMRYLLGYVFNPRIASDENYVKDGKLIEESVRNLLVDMVKLSAAGREPSFTESAPRQPPLRHEQFSRPPGQNIEMKRGDWICPKCSFMNFARNMRCLECNDARPKRILTGGEWECPQCDFFNYGRNMSCLRCDCKRPGETPLSTATPGASLGQRNNLNVGQILDRSGTDKAEIERKLAANDEKAERWFSKVSQLDDTSDLSKIADEDFPEIMPMRKGVNRFVVSTRKTPLERRLANAQNEGSESQAGNFRGMGSDRTSESSISQTLDRILGRTSTSSGTNTHPTAGERNAGAGSRFNTSEYLQSTANQRRNSDYDPFVPLPAEMFSKSQNSNGDVQSADKGDSASMKADQPSEPVPTISGSPAENKNEKESSDAAERWSRKVTELDNVTDSASAVSDDDFPDIMPMRKGENRFVISKKKDRSLTSPQYKRRIALEQANNSNFVPFVPFPPDYFAKKDKQPEVPPNLESASQGSVPPEKVRGVPEKWEESKTSVSNWGSAGYAGNIAQQPGSQADSQSSIETRITDFSVAGKNSNESIYGEVAAGNTAPSLSNTWYHNKESWNSGYSEKSTFSSGNTPTSSLQQSENAQNVREGWNQGHPGVGGYSGKSIFSSGSTPTSSPQQPENSQNVRDGWNQGYAGRSLEGSAVKEPDPLDMSEEAKAERWFRRVAQIKDISELSNIPDEDFPEIMPMRKGVNRFVVSKRKTPLERRLTSPQYRRNLPIVSSEPEKDAS